MLNWANCTPPAAEAGPEGVVFSQIGFAGYRLFRSIHCSSHFDWHLRTELETPDAAVWEAGGSCWGWTSLVSYCTGHRASRSCSCLFHPALPCHPPAAARGHLLPQVSSPKTTSSCGFSGLWAQPFLLFLSVIPLDFHRNRAKWWCVQMGNGPPGYQRYRGKGTPLHRPDHKCLSQEGLSRAVLPKSSF